MTNKTYNLYIISLLYAIFIAYIIPWTTIYHGEFVDTLNYLKRIEYLSVGGTERVYTGFSWLLSEPLWKYIIIEIGLIFDDYRFALYLISILIVFLYSIFIFKRVPYPVGMILLFNPMFIDLVMAQVRSALAFAILLLAYDLKSKIWTTILSIMAILIHASMPLFILIYFLLNKLNKSVSPKKYYLITIVTALLFALFVKYGVGLLLKIIGDRHAGYENVIASASLSYSIVWFIIGLIVATFATFKNEEDRIIAGYAITMTSFFFFSSLLGNFAQRYVALTMPLIIISVSYLPKHYKQGTYLLFFMYILLMFKYKLANVGF
jgi:hypothetical protein